MRKIFLLLSLLIVVACNDKKEEAKTFAQSKIKPYLKDPESAKFKFVSINRLEQNDNHSDIVHVCGLVNAKNSFGAFTGYSNFVVSYLDSPSRKVLHKELSSPASSPSDYWQRYCPIQKS